MTVEEEIELKVAEQIKILAIIFASAVIVFDFYLIWASLVHA